MAEKTERLNKESIAFASKKKPRMRLTHLNTPKPSADSVDMPKADNILENTLVSTVKLSTPLTKREMEVLKFIVAGKTNKKIARMLCRTERTVEYHRNRLMRKFNAHNAADLVKRAITKGIA